MPRHARLDAPGTLHHVIGRGIAETKIFQTKKDREDFGKKNLSSNMRRLLTGFVVNFNKRHKRYGHLFQNRYKSIVCEEDPYLLGLTRYIHLNPLRTGSE
jgi:putative transposase